MKLITLLFISMISSLYAGDPSVVTSPVDHVFVPMGFDNNDNIELVVTGKFPNPCFSMNKVDVDVKEDKIFINVTALTSGQSADVRCAPLPVPFKEEVTIGHLQGGDYQVIVNANTEHELTEKIHVAVSTSNSVDEHYYAISEYVELGFTGGLAGHAILFAKSPSSCLVFDRIEYLSNKKDTLSVLPIMKKVSNVCVERTERFEVDIKFDPRNFPNDKILIFVRSMEGKSINNLVVR